MDSEQHSTLLTVSQLTQQIKTTLESKFPLVTLQGEISNFKQQSSGHLYFSLKDADAQIQAVMFRSSAASLSQLPKEGDSVIVKGEVNVYPPQGKYQLLIKEMQLAGLGALLLKLEEMKRKIQKKGWFKKEFKKPLPFLPQKIGVVTSPTGAAIQDVLNVLTRRFSGVHVIINPVRVQGAEAAKEVADAIADFNRYQLVDVILVCRGGGSVEDLWAFNEEIVAEAIFNSRIPIVCAIGHETDHCIAEYVADVRAPTPSAAAELIMAEQGEQLKLLQKIATQINQAMAHLIRQYRIHLTALLKQPVLHSSDRLFSFWLQRLDLTRQHIDQAIKQTLSAHALKLESQRKQIHGLQPQVQIAAWREKLAQLTKGLDRTLLQNLERKNEQLKQIAYTLRSIDPKNLLKNGYSILLSEKDGSVIKSIHTVEKNDSIRILVADGELVACVNSFCSNFDFKGPGLDDRK